MLLLQRAWAQNRELVDLAQVEVQARTLIDHIRIETFRTQQTDPCGQLLPLCNQLVELGLQSGNLPLDPGTTNETELSIQRVKAEIGKNSSRNRRNDQTAKKRLLTLTSGGDWHDDGPNKKLGWSDSIMRASWLREG